MEENVEFCKPEKQKRREKATRKQNSIFPPSDSIKTFSVSRTPNAVHVESKKDANKE